MKIKDRIEKRKRIKEDIKDYKKAIRFASTMEQMCIREFNRETDPEKALDILNDMKRAACYKEKYKERVKILKKELRP